MHHPMVIAENHMSPRRSKAPTRDISRGKMEQEIPTIDKIRNALSPDKYKESV